VRLIDGYSYAIRDLPDGRQLSVDPLTYGRARLHISSMPGFTYDDGW
jgi:hypothetical protein